MTTQTSENTVFAGISPSRLISDLLCLAEWFATKPSDYGGEYTDGWRVHDALFKDDAFDYLYKTHLPNSQDRKVWTRLSWDDKATLTLMEAEYLSTMLD